MSILAGLPASSFAVAAGASNTGEADQMGSAATLPPDIERRRLRALAEGDTDTAAPLHAEEYQLITPSGAVLTKDGYLSDVKSGRLPYRVFEPITDIAVLGDAPVAVLRYQARSE